MNAGVNRTWTNPAAVLTALRRLWDRGDLLADGLTDDSRFPLRLPIRGPNSAEIRADYPAVQDWVSEWRGTRGLQIEWARKNHRLFGAQELPVAVVFPDRESAVQRLEMGSCWKIFQKLIEVTRARFPELLPWLAHRPHQALALAPEWSTLLDVIEWMRQHPQSQLYLRQIDLPGVSTKFIEAHRGVLTELMDRVLPPSSKPESMEWNQPLSASSRFARRFGFRDKPERVRVRFLDSACVLEPRLGTDLTLDASVFGRLNPSVRRVFITENEVNFLAFPDFPESLVLFGSGYGWSALRPARWLQRCAVVYWGDIDTHGYAILDELRALLPHVESLLMDPETFEACSHLATSEPDPIRRDLPRLPPEELSVYDALRFDTERFGFRLEQERIPFSRVHAALDRFRFP